MNREVVTVPQVLNTDSCTLALIVRSVVTVSDNARLGLLKGGGEVVEMARLAEVHGHPLEGDVPAASIGTKDLVLDGLARGLDEQVIPIWQNGNGRNYTGGKRLVTVFARARVKREKPVAAGIDGRFIRSENADGEGQ